jgi:hypothetical protein
VDSLTAFVAIAHIKLRLEILQRQLKKNPRLLETDMEIRRPMELAGLKSRLARAKKQEADIAVIGKRYDAVMDKIDELSGAASGNVGALEQYEADLRSTVMGMIAGDNGAPPLDDGQLGQSGEVAQPVAATAQVAPPVAADTQPPADRTVTAP